MEKDIEMYLEKYRFIKGLEEVIIAAKIGDIVKIDYHLDDKYIETISIEYRGGWIQKIPTSGNSNIANLMVIAEAICGRENVL